MTNVPTTTINLCNERTDHTYYCTVFLKEHSKCSFFMPIPEEIQGKLSDHDRIAHPCRFEYDETRWQHDLFSHCRSKEAVTHCKEAIQKDNYLIELLASSSPSLLKKNQIPLY